MEPESIIKQPEHHWREVIEVAILFWFTSFVETNHILSNIVMQVILKY